MGTKLVSPRAELAVLRGMTSKDRKIAGTLISSIDDTYFYSPESVELYYAIKKQMAESGEAPTYRLLLEDPDLSDEAREHFKNSKPTVESVQDAKKAARILNGLRQRRGLFNIAAHINNEFKKPRVDIESLLDRTSTGLNIVRSRKSTQDSFVHFGKNNNSLDIVKSILWEDNSDNLIPTGIKAFDDVSGGLARGSMVTIGANSGGGKCLLGNTEVLLPGGKTTSLEAIWNSADPSTEVPAIYDKDGVARYRNINLPVQTYEGVYTAGKVFKTKGKTFRIELENGSIIEGLGEHMLMVRDLDNYRGYFWKRLDALSSKDDILSYEEMLQLLYESRLPNRGVANKLYHHLQRQGVSLSGGLKQIQKFVYGPRT
jgi:hypothetical protein